jgi:hypothetical protein
MRKAATPSYCSCGKTAFNAQDDRQRGKNWRTSAVLGILALACLVGLSGCKSEPSKDQARKIVEASYNDLTPVGVKVIDFRKQNGEAKVVDGQKTYVYHFFVALELPVGIGWRPAISVWPGGFANVPPPSYPGDVSVIKPLPAGGTAIGMGTITFRETEKGWTATSLDERDDGYCRGKISADACSKQLGWDKPN